MIEITELRRTKRGRISLYTRGEYLFTVDAETLARNGVAEGDCITREVLLGLQEESDTRRASDAALRYLALRAYGERELYHKLLLRYEEPAAAAAVEKMRDAGLLDDAVFAAEKAKGMAERGKTKVEIRQKLLALGIGRELADEACASLEIDSVQAAADLVKKKYLDALMAGRQDKVRAALARRGFSYNEISQAFDAVQQEPFDG